jgi:hypothetical protein
MTPRLTKRTFIDETAEAHRGKSMKKPGDGCPKARWDPSNDATLIDVLLKEKAEGRQSASGFEYLAQYPAVYPE